MINTYINKPIHVNIFTLVTYDENMSPIDPEALFQQKIPQVYLELQENIQSAVVAMKINEKPPVMRSVEFRYIIML